MNWPAIELVRKMTEQIEKNSSKPAKLKVMSP